MSDNRNFQDYGQQFKTEIEHALNDGDFSGLKRLVSDSVDMALSGAADQVTRAADFIYEGVGQAFGTGKSGAQEKFQPQKESQTQGKSRSQKESQPQEEAKPQGKSQPQEESWMQRNHQSHGQYQPQGQDSQTDASKEQQNARGYGKYDFRTDKTAPKNSPRAARFGDASTDTSRADKGKDLPAASDQVLFKKKGNVSGTLFQVFGGIGTGICGVTTLVFLLIYIFMPLEPMLATAILFFLLMTGSLMMLAGGGRRKARLNRAQRYFELCQKSGYVNISRIATEVGRKEKNIVKDLYRLIENGTFPQGHLDRQQKCFMLTDSAYAEYQKVDEQRRQYELESSAQYLTAAAGNNMAQADGTAQADGQLTEEQKQLREMVVQGREYIRQIREKNDAIAGEVITRKLRRMENLLEEIFANLEKMPQQMQKMQRLMQYYLPTTLKLVTAYEQFDHMSVQGEDIVSAKKEIEDTIDTINDAFGELLNKLFAFTAMDVTTDAQVLKTMLVREGLVEGELEHVR